MHSLPVLLVSLSGCIPKKKISIRTHKACVAFKGQELRVKRWFKLHPNTGKFESLLTAKDAKSACRKLMIKLDMQNAPLAAFYMERE